MAEAEFEYPDEVDLRGYTPPRVSEDPPIRRAATLMAAAQKPLLYVGGGMLKAVCFGFIASWLAVWFGWSARPTSEGVALATTQTVIATAITVLLLDFILSALML